jgi:hypothetical protein
VLTALTVGVGVALLVLSHTLLFAYLGLLLTSFIAGTLLPFLPASSEMAMAGLLAVKAGHPLAIVAVARKRCWCFNQLLHRLEHCPVFWASLVSGLCVKADENQSLVSTLRDMARANVLASDRWGRDHCCCGASES